MASLSAVKMALKRDNRKDAIYMLQKVLKECPSAEAHYLAAKLAPNNLMAKKQLFHALHYDPAYEEALTLLAVIEREETLKASTANLRNTLLEDHQDEQDDSYFGRFNRWLTAV